MAQKEMRGIIAKRNDKMTGIKNNQIKQEMRGRRQTCSSDRNDCDHGLLSPMQLFVLGGGKKFPFVLGGKVFPLAQCTPVNFDNPFSSKGNGHEEARLFF